MTNYHDKRYGWPTTRCFPRTMKDAFKDDPENAQWWFPPERHTNWTNAVMWITGVMLWVSLAYWFVKG